MSSTDFHNKVLISIESFFVEEHQSTIGNFFNGVNKALAKTDLILTRYFVIEKISHLLILSKLDKKEAI